MAAFQSYTGVSYTQGETKRWSCYATCPVYEVRAFDSTLPAPPSGRKWVMKRQHGRAGPHLALLVDDATADFSHMLAQVTEPRSFIDA